MTIDQHFGGAPRLVTVATRLGKRRAARRGRAATLAADIAMREAFLHV